MKLCRKCNETKDLDQFYKLKNRPRPYCKQCMKKDSRQYEIKTNYAHANKYRKKNLKRFSEYVKKRRQEVNYKIADNLRIRLCTALKNNRKSGSAVRDLGCTIPEFKQYIESKFTQGMSWNNYGKWHLDHIYPLSKVNLSDREQFLKVAHYTNYQPLWAVDNIRKSNSLPSIP